MPAVTVPYTTFKQQAESGNVEAIYSKGASIEGPVRGARRVAAARGAGPAVAERAAKAPRCSAGLTRPPEPRPAKTFKTTLPAFVDPGLERS